MKSVMISFICLYISFKIFLLNENFRNSIPPNDVFSKNDEKIYKSEKPIELVVDHVELSDLSDDENLLSLSPQDDNAKGPQQKFENDSHDLSSRGQIDAEQSISNGKY